MNSEHTPADEYGDPTRYFNILAPQYNRISDEQGWPEQSAALLGKVAIYKEVDSINSYLDLGSGSGHTIDAVQKFSDPGRIVAVEGSKEMLALLKSRHAGPHLNIVQARIEEFIPQVKDKFDLVTAMSTLEFIKDLPPIMRQICGLLASQGILAATYIPVPESGKTHHTVDSTFGAQEERITEFYCDPVTIKENLELGEVSIIHEESIDAYKRESETISYTFIIAQKI